MSSLKSSGGLSYVKTLETVHKRIIESMSSSVDLDT